MNQCQQQLIKHRDELLEKLELKYMRYIQVLLSQKMLITAEIRHRYDELLYNRTIPIKITPKSSVSQTNSVCTVPDILPSPSLNIQSPTNFTFAQPPNLDGSIVDSKLFCPHMSLIEASKLQINERIDHRDTEGRFLGATIIDKNGSNLKVHYIDWNQDWDCWSDYSTELFRFAKYKSISERPLNRFFHLQTGDNIKINPMNKGWKIGNIKSFDAASGQIEVCYEIENLKSYYWSHIDNESEVTIITGESLYKFDCLYCSKTYQCHLDLVNHIKSTHSERAYVCRFCSFASARSSGIKTHERQHTIDAKYNCNHCFKLFGCNSSFEMKHHLSSHINSIHKKSKRGCKRKLDNKCDEKVERKYSCLYCNKIFDRKNHQLSHEKHFHEGEFSC